MGSFLLLALLVFCLLSSLCLFKVWTHSFRLSILRTTPGSYGPCPQPSFVWGGLSESRDEQQSAPRPRQSFLPRGGWEKERRWRGGGLGVGGGGVISCLPSPSPTCPVASSPSASIFCVSPWASPPPAFFSIALSIYRFVSSLAASFCLSPAFWAPARGAGPSRPPRLSVYLSVCLSDCLTSAPTVVPFVSADKWGWPFIVKQTPTGRDETAGV